MEAINTILVSLIILLYVPQGVKALLDQIELIVKKDV